MRLVDFHSHILPHMDDGAKDADTSLGMLSALASQGVDTVFATPHFYADENSVEEFIERRNAAFAELSAAMEGKTGLPQVLLGAEIMTCKQLSGIDLSPLVFCDIPIMLFEYPVASYEAYYASLTARIAAANAAIPMIAHFDRYEWSDAKTLAAFSKADPRTYFQMNCQGISERKNLKLLHKLYGIGANVVFGSDCHDLAENAPDFHLLNELFSKPSVPLDVLGVKKLPTAYLKNALEESQENVLDVSEASEFLI